MSVNSTSSLPLADSTNSVKQPDFLHIPPKRKYREISSYSKNEASSLGGDSGMSEEELIRHHAAQRVEGHLLRQLAYFDKLNGTPESKNKFRSRIGGAGYQAGRSSEPGYHAAHSNIGEPEENVRGIVMHQLLKKHKVTPKKKSLLQARGLKPLDVPKIEAAADSPRKLSEALAPFFDPKAPSVLEGSSVRPTLNRTDQLPRAVNLRVDLRLERQMRRSSGSEEERVKAVTFGELHPWESTVQFQEEVQKHFAEALEAIDERQSHLTEFHKLVLTCIKIENLCLKQRFLSVAHQRLFISSLIRIRALKRNMITPLPAVAGTRLPEHYRWYKAYSRRFRTFESNDLLDHEKTARLFKNLHRRVRPYAADLRKELQEMSSTLTELKEYHRLSLEGTVLPPEDVLTVFSPSKAKRRPMSNEELREVGYGLLKPPVKL